jgi:CubicO group peptidase (beta-lactamase class C family)
MTVRPNQLEAVSQRVARRRDEHHVPGVAVAVCDATGPLWSGCFGTARRGSDRPVTPQTLWSLQSQSKMYTATAVLIAVQDGLLDLDAPITSYLPDFSVRSPFEADPAGGITLRHLLSHTAGFTHEAPEGSNYRVGSASFAAHCASIRRTWLRCPVGHHFEYSNLGIDLAAEILVTVTGTPFATYLRQRLLIPLGASRATFDPRAVARDADRAEGHHPGRHRMPVRVPMVASGGLWASVEDACRYASFHLSRGAGLVDPALLEEQYEARYAPADQQVRYGLGTISRRRNGILLRGHSGGGFGFLSDTYWAPEHGIGVAVVTNSDDHPLQGDLVFDILDDFVGAVNAATTPQLPARLVISADDAATLAGDYVSRDDRVTIRSDGHALVLEEDGAEHVLRPIGQDMLVLEDGSGEAYRVLSFGGDRAAYLQRRSDGFTRCRNRLPDLDGATVARRFGVRKFGRPDGVATLVVAGGGAGQLTFADEPAVRVEQRLPGLWFAAHGEVLDLTCSPPTYANIELHEHRSSSISSTREQNPVARSGTR